MILFVLVNSVHEGIVIIDIYECLCFSFLFVLGMVMNMSFSLLGPIGRTEIGPFKLVWSGPVLEGTTVQSGLENSRTEGVGPVPKHGQRSG